MHKSTVLSLLLAGSAAIGSADAGLAAGGPGRAPLPIPHEQATSLDDLIVIHHAGDVAIRDRLRRVSDLWLDAGHFLVGRVRPRVRAWLAANDIAVDALPAIADDEELFLVGLDEDVSAARLAARGARLLFRQGDQALVSVVAADHDAHEELHTLTSERFLHCGVVPFERRGMALQRPFTPPAIAHLGSGGDPAIQALVDQVDESNIEATVVSLSSLFTRRSTEPGGTTAQNQIQATLNGLGLTTSLQQFNPAFARNVVAEIPGIVDPNKVVVIGAHYDTINLQDGAGSNSPGSDDNASGTGGVLEAARIFAGAGSFKYTLRFILFAGEESGLLGSNFDSGQSLSNGEEIIGMLNMDMISYRAPGDTRDVDFATNNTSAGLTAFCDQIGELYVPDWASSMGILGAGSSDHASYNADGWPAVFFFEDLGQFYGQIHTANDVYPTSNTDFLLSKMILQGVIASAATLAEPADMTISHTELGDRTLDPGSFEFTCEVTSLNAGNVTDVELYYSVDGGPFSSVEMARQSGDEWFVELPSFGNPAIVDYYFASYDDQGGFEDLPAGASASEAPFRMVIGAQVELVAYDFEAAGDQGWTHGQDAQQDDWQRGSPNGSGGDPNTAVSGSNVWGNDLAPSGFNGLYQANVSNWLRSPSFDLSGSSQVFLRYQRWLTVEDGLYDQAQIRINGTVVWENVIGTPGDDQNHTVDTSWTPQLIDISAQAAGNPSVQIEYRLISDGGLQFGGWNLDDVALISLEAGASPAARQQTATTPLRVP